MPDVFDEIQQGALDVRPKDRAQVMANAQVMQSINENAITPSPIPKANVFVEIDDKARNVTTKDRAQAMTGKAVFAEINDSAITPSAPATRNVYGEINDAAMSVSPADTNYIDTGVELFADINQSALAAPAPRRDVFGEISDFVEGDVTVKPDALSGLPSASPTPMRPQPLVPTATGGFVSAAPRPARRPQGRHPFLSRTESRLG